MLSSLRPMSRAAKRGKPAIDRDDGCRLSDSQMNRSEFMREFRRLETEYGKETPSTGCISSTNLIASAQCMFSDNLENCYRCTHCSDCKNCSNLSHSTGCVSCNSSAYLVNSQYCNASAYLIYCIGCSQCNYCIGCVGLHKKDFHILNRPYSRSEYFQELKRLKRELGIK